MATGYYHININLFSPDANSNNIPDVNIVYFDLTLGNAKAYFSAGYGKDLKYMGSQFVSSNGFVRFGRKIGMASQIWLIPEPRTFYIIYLGPQINGKHNQFNFGVILTSSFNRNVYFPYLSYIYRF